MSVAVGPSEGDKTATVDVTHDGGGTTTTSTIGLAATIINPHYGGGGEDAGGYFFANTTFYSDGAPSQPVFDWIDVSTSGTEITSDFTGSDVVAGPYSLGFTFRFFGEDVTEYYLDSNGWLSFDTNRPDSEYSNEELPSTADPDNLIAWFWDDLDPTDSDVSDVHIYRGSATVDGRNAHVITFERMSEEGGFTDDWITAQVVLIQSDDPSKNGKIKLQYKEHGAGMTLDCATVGIEGRRGRDGLTYLHDGRGGPLFSSPLAVEFGPEAGTFPVELAAFDARVDGVRVRLTWQTASETNNAGFKVERRIADAGGEAGFASVRASGEGAATDWRTVGALDGAGTTTARRTYRFTDADLPFGAERLTYRLRQVDLDGTATYSDPVEVRLGLPERLTLQAPFPNPVRHTATLRYTLPTATDVTIAVYNVLGQRVATAEQRHRPAGRAEHRLDTSRWAPGTYFVRLVAGETVRTQRLTVVR